MSLLNLILKLTGFFTLTKIAQQEQIVEKENITNKNCKVFPANFIGFSALVKNFKQVDGAIKNSLLRWIGLRHAKIDVLIDWLFLQEKLIFYKKIRGKPS
jgi:hypothetical protein